MRDFAQVLPHHPIVEGALADLAAGRPLDPIIRNAKDGAAEVLYGLGGAGSRQGDELAALIYLRLALYLRPDHALAAVTVADLYEQLKQSQSAIDAYEMVPDGSPMRASANIQAGLSLDALGRSDDAIKRLQDIVAANPKDIDALSALGSLQRSAKNFADAAQTYDKAIALLDKPDRSNWTLFYFRAICFERTKQWPKAEADFKKALELFPDQPLVLNYLGYSWVDQGVNLDEAFKMLRRAVDLRPTDGYVVDSLGWANFKLGHYDEATRELEKAIELKPADPVVNDHLGDAYWRMGRKLDAHFQWNHARDMGPEPEDLPAILKKIDSGLPDEPSPPRRRGRAEKGRRLSLMSVSAGRARLWRAPAKVNLTLHILGRREDGWHELDSVVAFAGCCDWLSFEPGEALSLTVEGPTAASAGEIDENLVLRAARALSERVARTSARPLSSRQKSARRGGPWRRLLGRGGGVARARARKSTLPSTIPGFSPPRKRPAPTCPFVLIRGRGSWPGSARSLGPCLRLPPLFAVLVNPRVAVATPAVFARLGLAKGAPSGFGASPALGVGADRSTAIDALREGRNDMEAGACALAPAISDVLDALSAARGAALVRMSGSGATCFALFEESVASPRARRGRSAKRIPVGG